MKKIIILGGGLSGLAAADILSRNHNVIVLERSKQLGGLAASFVQDGMMIPAYYHHVVSHNAFTRSYLDRYGLMDGSEWKPVKIVIGVDGRLHDITNPFGLLRFNHLSLSGRIRFGVFGLYSIFAMDPKKIPEGMDAKDWLYSVAGQEVTDKVFSNLYARNKFNIPLTQISANQLANRLKEKEVYDDFTYPPGGLNSLVKCLESDIKKNGGIIIKNVNIKSVDLKKKIVKTQSIKYEGDMIISTIPLPELLPLSSGIPSGTKKKMEKVRYCPGICITFGTKDFLDKNHYWTNLFGERIHVIIQHSILSDKYKSKINWCIRYGGSEEDMGLSDQEIKKEYLSVIKKYYPDADILWSKVVRTKYAEPVYDKDYAKYMIDHRTDLKGF
ncbi:hypothetical protein COT47_05150, partial [Candidatus Woesearchaeota archaeon CG08_land_8_20_14_0_20_43_7]